MSGVGTYDPNGTLIGSYWIPDYVDDPTGRTIQPGLQNPNVQINGNLGVTGTITGTISAAPPTQLATDTTAVTINTNHPTAAGQSLISTSTTNATWQAPAVVSLTTGVSGVLPIANGGTNQSTVGSNGTVLTSNGTTTAYVAPSTLTVGNATAAVTATNLATGTVGQLPVQTGTGTTGFVTSGASGSVLVGQGTGVAPIFALITKPIVFVFASGTAQTYTPPATCSFIFVTAAGGGGGGGGTFNTNSQGAGGGGGGGGWFYSVYPGGNSFLYTVGAGGTAGTVNNDGSNGGDTTFKSNATGLTDTAGGGLGGNKGITSRGGNAAQGGTVTINNTSNVVYNSKGGAGSAGQLIMGGNGGSTILASPTGGTGLGTAGAAGDAGGGGGAGGNSSGSQNAGGAGGVGQISIIEFYA